MWWAIGGGGLALAFIFVFFRGVSLVNNEEVKDD